MIANYVVAFQPITTTKNRWIPGQIQLHPAAKMKNNTKAPCATHPASEEVAGVKSSTQLGTYIVV